MSSGFRHLVRIKSTDLPGPLPVHLGLSRISGVNRRLAHTIVRILGIPPTERIGSLTDASIKDIESMLSDPTNLGVPEWMLNRRKDRLTGKDIHLTEAEAGDVIGEMSLIKEGVRSANVKAEKAGFVYMIDVREFYNNIYNVPGWFMELIQGLVQRLRDTNEMLDQIMKDKKEKEKSKKWPTPFCMIMDSSNPGKFLLKGTVNINNLQYLKQVLRVEISRHTEKITIDLSRVKQIDKESIAGFLNLYTQLKKKNINLVFEGPQKSILNLFKQYDLEE